MTGDGTGRDGRLAGAAVARVGFGAMQLEGRGRPLSDQDAVAVVRRAVELGVDHFDTAEFYGGGTVNRRLHAALAPYDDVVVVTKVGAETTDRGLALAQRPEQLRAAVEANLRSLRMDRLPVVNLRRADQPPGLVATGDQVVDLDSQLAELTALREAGKIAAIGLSNVDLGQLRAALPAGIVCVQNAYSVLHRDGEPLLQECERHGIAWVPYFPLGSAFGGDAAGPHSSASRPVPADPVVRAVAGRLGATPAQIGLAWLLQHSPVTLLIPGTSGVAHLEQNVAAGRVRLDAAAVAELDRLAG
ncbi:aldo/keto reductase [Nakamurella endophytica]|uniref:Oxidoreductase n=1 Tax=Nakamurella endophytica TaxID=1748367 RepID=A0A917SUW5_9ACTN|nr:aldo/keto reductase [Nakamurella endophytica]GGL96616.1 oxidoreductase [Nakamurella endophytica]